MHKIYMWDMQNDGQFAECFSTLLVRYSIGTCITIYNIIPITFAGSTRADQPKMA
jgi:heme/copper-type cytochrome/quinol oxidase subunit 1